MAAEFGFYIGTVFGSALIPVILLIVLKLIPATRARHGLNYGISGVLATLMPWVSGVSPMALAASLLLAALFGIGYLRASRPTK